MPIKHQFTDVYDRKLNKIVFDCLDYCNHHPGTNSMHLKSNILPSREIDMIYSSKKIVEQNFIRYFFIDFC
jgi:hypothetical protein